MVAKLHTWRSTTNLCLALQMFLPDQRRVRVRDSIATVQREMSSATDGTLLSTTSFLLETAEEVQCESRNRKVDRATRRLAKPRLGLIGFIHFHQSSIVCRELL